MGRHAEGACAQPGASERHRQAATCWRGEAAGKGKAAQCPTAAFAPFELHVCEIRILGQQAFERSQITGANRRSPGNRQGIVITH